MSNLSLEYQVCTLEQAKELAKLLGEHTPGSLYVWVNYDEDYYDDPLYWNVYSLEYDIECDNCSVDYRMGSYIPAYTGDELGALLPFMITEDGQKLYLRSLKAKSGYIAKYESIPRMAHWGITSESQHEVHAKAALAIKGLKEGWILPEEFKYG